MYTAVGEKTKIIYIKAKSKSELMRQLTEEYKWKSAEQCFYPEPLKIEQLNRPTVDVEKLTEKERKKALLNNSDNEKVSRILRKGFRKNEVPRKRNDSRNVKVKCTIPNGEVLMFDSISDTARYFGIQPSTVVSNMDNEKFDSKGNFYERFDGEGVTPNE